ARHQVARHGAPRHRLVRDEQGEPGLPSSIAAAPGRDPGPSRRLRRPLPGPDPLRAPRPAVAPEAVMRRRGRLGLSAVKTLAAAIAAALALAGAPSQQARPSGAGAP